MQRARDDRRARQPCALKKEQKANCSCGQTTKNPGARAAARQQEAQHHRRQHGNRELVRAEARQRAHRAGSAPAESRIAVTARSTIEPYALCCIFVCSSATKRHERMTNGSSSASVPEVMGHE